MENKLNKNTQNLTDELKSPPKELPPEKIELDLLKEEAQKRAKKAPILQRIVKSLQGKDKSYHEIVINSEALEKRVALLVDGVLDKFEVERTGEVRMVGSIFKGKIQNLEAGLKAAFVDIGQEKNAFLHYWDIIPTANDSSVEIVRENRSAEQQRKVDKFSIKDIPQMYPVGTDIMIQITKTQIGSKGPRTTTNIALPGRYIVLMPNTGQCGISRKIEDRKERDRLKKILRSLTIPEGMGVIIRTAGEGKKARFFVRDLHLLLQKWEAIQKASSESTQPSHLYQEPDLLERTVRDFLTEDIDRVLVDNEEDYKRILEIIQNISPRSKSKIHRFKEGIPIFERFNIERQVEQTFQRTVPLISGGEIVIEETEALTAIDVNTGSHKNARKDAKNFIVNCNLEAAKEAARQIRLRNIGGLIVLDFIDMKNKRDRKAVLDVMRTEMSKDKAKCHILPISQLGIMQMSRQRHEESKSSGLYTECPYCTGRGIVKSARTMSAEIQRRLISVIRHARHSGKLNPSERLELLILLHPSNLERLRTEDESHLVEIEEAYNAHLSFRADPSYHIENFKVVDPKTEREFK
jgi:ribonuclease G